MNIVPASTIDELILCLQSYSTYYKAEVVSMRPFCVQRLQFSVGRRVFDHPGPYWKPYLGHRYFRVPSCLRSITCSFQASGCEEFCDGCSSCSPRDKDIIEPEPCPVHHESPVWLISGPNIHMKDCPCAGENG